MYRAYWAIPRTLKTRAGEQANTVFGVASMLLSILAKEEPDAFLFCFDEGDQTFRHQEAKDYKAGRAETPDDFYMQIPRVHELIDTFAIPHVSDPRFEADDLLCAYARAAEQAGMRVTIVTGDRDALQLASDSIRIAIPHKGYQQAEYLGPKEIEAKYGVRPDQIPSYKGLTGDQSDNLPGVKGIGPKTAAELLQKYDTLKNIYDHLEEIRPAVREKLAADREQAFFCERMALLVTDLPLLPFDQLSLGILPVAKIQEFFRAMEFTLLIKRLQAMLQTSFGRAHCAPEDVSLPAPSEAKTVEQMILF
ncbi:MAG: 5'-3' exonuclease H3TH domain-containing protein [Candidatus Peribacteraceae bacterium]|nr:5'-3' exonuclease H3TH domain-containing protein [Candidatus Peribacteraceae bacterium]MDD5742509.1 5'-3' exonuclease H3TH domain-containing protein [Candidatus Peribacteraceae bacterium]